MSDGLDLGDVYPVCVCGRRAHIYTSCIDSNPGRRFWGCANYRGDLNCGFFRWFDPPICARSKQIIPGLLRRLRELEMRLGERDGLRDGLQGIDEESSSAAGFRGDPHIDSRKRNWCSVLLLVIMILFVLGKKIVDNM
ncbi:hypothetical protein Q3G72_022964 [Acer saccharum]|nr:hypothetical protein Q3G72_022964 [Acer saccharum]